MTNYVCAKCGGRWLPRESARPPDTCPWCRITDLEVENRTLKLDLTQAQAEAHRLFSRYEAPEIIVGNVPMRYSSERVLQPAGKED